jgi:hypothetical protein
MVVAILRPVRDRIWQVGRLRDGHFIDTLPKLPNGKVENSSCALGSSAPFPKFVIHRGTF